MEGAATLNSKFTSFRFDFSIRSATGLGKIYSQYFGNLAGLEYNGPEKKFRDIEPFELGTRRKVKFSRKRLGKGLKKKLITENP